MLHLKTNEKEKRNIMKYVFWFIAAIVAGVIALAFVPTLMP